MVSARWRGSSGSGGRGRPCATSQNGQRRVQRSPRIMKVAVPLPKHSAMFGQDASSQTVCSFCSRRIRLTAWKCEPALAARTRIQSGLGSFSLRKNRKREVFSAPFSLTPASRMFNSLDQQFGELRSRGIDRELEPQIPRLRHPQAGITAGIDRLEGREVHVHVEGESVEGATPGDADAERRDLGAVYIHPRRAGNALRAFNSAFGAPQEIDHRLLQHGDELLYLDAAAR